MCIAVFAIMQKLYWRERYLRNMIEIIIKDNILTRSMLIRQFIKGRIINNISFMIHDGGLVQLSIRL